ncbi:methyl-accepting chemotaxis protein [Coleofasciculus sp. G2-EDA-02]|uniref:methyl-accepting chemotaxis protein n=1 Tax=Coleofasciculus sp. G2-EDA-02 TaxID=3069529 RepID=UPI0032FA1CBF
MTQTSPNTNSAKNNGAISKLTSSDDGAALMDYPLSAHSLSTPTPNALKRLEPDGGGYKAKNQTIPTQHSSTSWWQRLNLRNKATAVAILIGTLPVLVTGITAYYFADRAVVTEIAEAKIARAEGMEDKVIRFMRERYGDIQVMASLQVLTDPKLVESTTLAQKQTTLDNYIEFYKIYDSIAVFDLNGNVIVQSQGEPLGNHSDRDYIQAALKLDQPYIGNPGISDSSGKFVIHIAAPVKDQVTGKTIGTIRSRMPVEALDDLVSSFGAGGDQYHLIDLSEETPEIFVSNQPDKQQKNAAEVFAHFEQLKTAGKPGSTVTTDTIDNSQDLLAYAPLHELEGVPKLPWSAAVATPTKIAFEPQRQLLLALASGTALTALLVSAVAAAIANRATTPIVSAADAVTKIGQGDLDTRLNVAGEDELAVLGKNINDMAQQLGSLVQQQTLAAEKANLLAEITSVRSFDAQAIQDIFDIAVINARKIYKADRVIVYRLNSDGSGEAMAESVTPGQFHAFNSNIKHPPLSPKQLATHSDDGIVAITNITAAGLSAEQLKFMEHLEVKSTLDVLLLSQGQPFALLSVHHCQNSHPWQPEEIDFLQRLADQMRLSLDRLTLLDQTRNLAEEQRQLKEGLQHRALELLKEVDPISKGDLTIRARVTEDEIGTIADSYNATVANLRKIVNQVQAAAGQVAETTSFNEVAVQSLAEEALHQAEEISVALDRAQEMAQSVRMVANNAEQALTAVQEASQMVQAGDVAMNRTVDGILAIRETVAETAKKVKHLGESSQKISTVVNLISTFAAQTNLLALNASIEAARAGEEGRGFAVVADEVRSLAQQSADATSEIEKLVAAIQAETNEVVTAMEAGTEQVVMGTKLVDETRASLNQITTVSAKISKLVEAITDATLIQTQAAESVTETMTKVANIAAHTSTGASDVSYSFEQLRQVAQALQAEVGQFKLS